MMKLLLLPAAVFGLLCVACSTTAPPPEKKSAVSAAVPADEPELSAEQIAALTPEQLKAYLARKEARNRAARRTSDSAISISSGPKGKKLIFDPDKLNSHKKREKFGDVSKPMEDPGSAFFWRDEPGRRSERINSSPVTY